LLALAAILALQAYGVLGLFGPQPLERLLSDEPIVSGRHALHLYHGSLGARSFWDRGTLCCYDPSFYAGYPKTPVFDSGSRPAELVLALTGGRGGAAAYKLGLAALCLGAPLASYFAVRAIRLRRGPACLAALLALLVWWGRPCREALESGTIDLLLAAVLWPLALACLLRYHRVPGPLALTALTLALLLGCFAHLPLFSLFLPLFFIYYLSTGPRHRWHWHAGLWAALAAAVGLNLFWLVDWVSWWWIRVPEVPGPLRSGSPWSVLWGPDLWGSTAERALCWGLLGAAVLGTILHRIARERPEAHLFGLGLVGLVVLAALGLTREWMRPWGAGGLLVPALLLAVVPATRAAAGVAALLRQRRAWRTAAAAIVATAAGTGFAFQGAVAPWLGGDGAGPLKIGIDDDARAVLVAIESHTTPSARILWEDRRSEPAPANWAPLLPLWTDRAFMGGLDAEAGIEHAAAGLTDGSLMGRPLDEWTDSELDDYCRWYNIGWVLCSSPKACFRFAAWKKTQNHIELPAVGKEGRVLFTVDRAHNFALSGEARWLSADTQRIILADVRPQRIEGRSQIVLSLHWKDWMRVTPSRVQFQPFDDPHHPFPLIRLSVTEPVARVTILWDRR
jgi:hypothetical protein